MLTYCSVSFSAIPAVITELLAKTFQYIVKLTIALAIVPLCFSAITASAWFLVSLDEIRFNAHHSL